MENKDFLEQLNIEEQRLLSLLEAVRKLKSAYLGENASSEKPKQVNIFDEDDRYILDDFVLVGEKKEEPWFFIDLNSEFNLKWDWREKVIYILHELGQADSTTVAERLHEYQPSIDPERCLDVARQHCSALKREDRVDYFKRGRGYVYKWKK